MEEKISSVHSAENRRWCRHSLQNRRGIPVQALYIRMCRLAKLTRKVSGCLSTHMVESGGEEFIASGRGVPDYNSINTGL